MREMMRLIATIIIWSAFITVAGVSLSAVTGPVANMNGGEIIGLMAVLMTGAIAMTYAVWHSGFQRAEDTQSARERLSKPKRAGRTRVERLIEDLEDEEIYRLEELLLGRDQSRDQQQREQ